MADEIRNGDSKARVIRLFGHRDDAGAWQIRDFWIELSTEEDFCRELGLSDLGNVNLPVVELPDGTRLAAGDVRHRSIKRVATAAGEGAMAIAFVHRYLEETA
jgi:hypothetical protein